jgi:hypothetical protein
MEDLPMIRMLALSPLFVSGCIIYEDDWRHGDCPRCEIDTGATLTATGDDDDDATNGAGTDTEPEPDPGPLLTADLELTETSAYAGDSLLSSLVVVSGQIDLAKVVSVGFERDIQVLDQLSRPGEIVLLLAVAADATPGEVDVFVETEVGAGYILATPFTVLEPEPACPVDPTGTDTGCP